MEVELQIDGRAVSVRQGQTIMDAAQKLGIYVPHFCYHPRLSIAANCRMCLVEVEKAPKPLPACATPASGGMVVRTQAASEKAKNAQHSVMEFLLINHPLDCPICDQGGECQLQDLAVGYGRGKSRYGEEKRVVFEKNLGPLISTDMTRCIHCTRCVRFGQEVAGIMELGMTGRGEHAEIMPFVERTVDSELSGNMADVCPVGALTSKPFRFAARTWELARHAGISPHDGWGSHLVWQSKGGAVKRVTPGNCDEINECWISDRDRFSCAGFDAEDRLTMPRTTAERASPTRKTREASWEAALNFTAAQIQKIADSNNASQLGFLLHPSTTTEEAFLAARMAEELSCKNIDFRIHQIDFSEENQEKPIGFSAPLASVDKLKHAFLLGLDTANELPLLGLRLRRMAKKRADRISSLHYVDLSPQAAGLHACAPLEAWPRHLRAVLSALKLGGGEDWASQAAAQLKSAGERGAIFVGASALRADCAGRLLGLAAELSAATGAALHIATEGANAAGCAYAGALPSSGGGNSRAMIEASLRGYILLGCEPDDFLLGEQLRRALQKADFVAHIGAFNGGFSSLAHALLPMALPPENDGGYINAEGRAQTFTAAVPPPDEARPAWKILRMLGVKLGLKDFAYNSLQEVREDLKKRRGEVKIVNTSQSADISDGAQMPLDGMEIEERAQPRASSSGKRDGRLWLAPLCNLYRSDPVTRRAAPLQNTARGRQARCVSVHPDDLAQLGLAHGAAATVAVGEVKIQGEVRADSRIARGCAGVCVQGGPFAPLGHTATLASGKISLSAAAVDDADAQAA